MIKKLISLPPNAVADFHTINSLSKDEYFCTSDPVGHKLGSGGGTVWILTSPQLSAERGEVMMAGSATKASAEISSSLPLDENRGGERYILIHAGGQSRRLPAYAASGKLSLPVPVFRWERGQRIDQTLMDLQLPLFEQIMAKAPERLRLLVASGDVLIRATQPLQDIPDADVVCYGLWVSPSLAKNHGVFFMNRHQPDVLDFMLQKPSTARLAELAQTHLAMMDIGLWLLSDKAIEVLTKRCKNDEGHSPESFHAYDLYSEFGCALGLNPSVKDDEVNELKVVILPLEGGEFYHYGTTPEMISSTLALQNKVLDQRLIIQKNVKKHPAVFTQNAVIETVLTEANQNIWIENSHVPATWTLTSENVITGVPENDWDIELASGQCVDVVPIGEDEYVLRPYGYRDPMKGDRQSTKMYPVMKDIKKMGKVLREMLVAPSLLFPVEDAVTNPSMSDALIDKSNSYLPVAEGKDGVLRLLSADEIQSCANLIRLHQQRQTFLKHNIPQIEENYRKSVFYQIDLKDLASKHVALGIDLPKPLADDALPMQRIHDAMFRSEVMKQARKLSGCGESTAQNGSSLIQEKGVCDADYYESQAFSLLQEQIVSQAISHPQQPRLDVYKDQIVWARSAVRIDIAGGWTDTPPHCLLRGGNVVNLAIELNGQQPLQVYVKPSKEMCITCRSIDLGAVERITTYEELAQFNKVGSPFSIPKAALALCGFLPQYSVEKFSSLTEHLNALGAGIEITLLSAIPAGSGLGTSSILASTVLGALSDFCGLGWDKAEIGNRSLMLEQLLTTGGGWQDQYGGILPGIKLLQTERGFSQIPVVRWLPDTFFRQADYQQCHLLYYTGVTRTAKHILAEIVQGMFLNSAEHLDILQQMKQQALTMFDAIQLGDFQQYGKLIRQTWQQNKALDCGTEPPVIAELCRKIDDFCLGYKLPGAGGGGYLYMVAKDAEAASRIRTMLTDAPLTPSARFVDMTLSEKGLQVSRS